MDRSLWSLLRRRQCNSVRRLDDMTGIDVARAMRERGSDAAILMLSVHQDVAHVEQAFAAGANGYLTKSISPAELADAIRRVLAGERVASPQVVSVLLSRLNESANGSQSSSLSEEELELLRLIAAGATNSEIAAHTAWSQATVKRRLARLYDHLRVTSRVEAVHVGTQGGLV